MMSTGEFGMSRRFVFFTMLLLVTPVAAEERPLRKIIDAEVDAGLKAQKITPAGKSTDAEFLRRIYIDLVGTIPTYDETVQFLKETDTSKRERLIDKLLEDPRFAKHQAEVWDLVLFGRHPAGNELTRNRDSFRKFLGEKIAKNEPYDQWVRDIMLTEKDGSEQFYAQFRNNPEEATVQISRLFLGTQLQCARCHDHPYDKWTQKDFFGMAGFFVRLVVAETGSANARKAMIGEKSVGEVLFAGAAKDLKPGQKGDPVKPKFLGGNELAEPLAPKDAKVDAKEGAKLPKPSFSRRDKIVEWITAKDNPYFAKAVTNRVWAQYMGRGLAHPVDDLSEKSQVGLPTLLKEAESAMKAHKFDIKWFTRELVNSETYQRTAKGPVTDPLPKWYEQARVRPLSAEEIIATFRQATLFDAEPRKDNSIPNSGDSYFMRFFGEPTDGLGEFQGSISEHLFLNNGHIWQMIKGRKGTLSELLATSKDSWEQKVDRLFLTVLSRPPSDAERTKFVAFLKLPTAKGETASNIDEAIWVLMNSPEFRFNH